ncbi:MAG: SDR family oxidoreductase [Hyphomicrobiales bacterium]
MHPNLDNKTVVITGASGGIGAATAFHFAKQGANVVLLARNLKKLQQIAHKIGNNALAIETDVSDFAQVERALVQANQHFGGIDILVNNAGTIEPIARIENSDPNEWQKTVNVNLVGVYNGLRAVHEYLAQNGGVIVNISSGAATSALEGWSHYCATKAAVLSLTKCAHKEWAEQNIRVVGLSPGTVATDMQHSIKSSGINPVSQLDWSAHIPPEWVAKTIAWLTTDAASEYAGVDFSLKTDEAKRLVGLI